MTCRIVACAVRGRVVSVFKAFLEGVTYSNGRTPGLTNMGGWKMDPEVKMYLLSKMVIFNCHVCLEGHALNFSGSHIYIVNHIIEFIYPPKFNIDPETWWLEDDPFLLGR